MTNTSDKTEVNSKDNQLYRKVAELIELARKKVATTVNLTMVHTYFEIGRMIVEDEQQGKERAAYGKSVLKELSVRLIERFGKGFSVDNLERMKNFYLIYSNQISATPLRNLKNTESQSNTIQQKPSSKTRDFTLNWSHYLVVTRIETLSQNWSEPQLMHILARQTTIATETARVATQI
jgi:hypothetical protein